jgi:hypothetical protein
MKSTLLIVAGCVAGLGLLIVVPVGLKSYMDAAPKREAAAKRKAQMAQLEAEARANEAAQKAKQDQQEAQAMADLRAKSARIQEIYNILKETAVTQPTRPMADAHQLVLEMHYLWKEVRNSSFWLSRPKERDQMDAMVSALVAEVDRDKKVRDAFSN